MKLSRKRLAITVAALVGVSLLSAFVGALIASSTLEGYAERLQNTVDMPLVSNVKPPVVPGTVQEAIEAVRERTQGASLGLYAGGTGEGVVLDDFLAVAIPLTTDGWIAYPQSAEALARELQLYHDDTFYPLTSPLTASGTGYRFVKTDVTDARVGTFGASERVAAGDIVYVVAVDRLMPRTIVSADWYPDGGARESSDQLSRRFLIDQPVNEVPGALLVDGSGSLLGILESETTVRPLHHITSSFESVLLSGDTGRALFGLTVIDAERVHTEAAMSGLVVTSVGVNSPVRTLLVAGDIITRINGRSVNELPLAELLLDVREGDTLVFDVERDGTAEEISVTL